jgi:hypothetical protein
MSEIKVNKISPRTACGTTTLGDSGDTFTIPAGVSITNNGTASGFGATGSASWNTTVKTSGFTAVAGEGYFLNTTSGTISVNLPAGTPGAVVAFKDYAGTFDTNKVTLVQNGSDKVGGSAVNPTLDTEGIAVTLVFIDSTQGWLVTDSGLQDEAPTASFISATGGTITTVCTNFKVHTFTGPGTFTVCSTGNAAGSNSVDYLVVAGGGSGGCGGTGDNGGGGGAGGYRESGGTVSGCYAVSPLGSSPSPVAAIPVTAQGYPIVVGAGGAGSQPKQGAAGSVSSGLGISSAGGGGGAANATSPGYCSPANGDGGSGGGGRGGGGIPGVGGNGNTPPVSPAQGFNGGSGGVGLSPDAAAGGGGGATAVGATATAPAGGAGGAGATSSINGTPTARAGGGGGGAPPSTPNGNRAPGGTGGGGQGGAGGGGCASAGTVNTGGGGGGSSPTTASAAAGGSGIVIIRYKFQ